jgi:putative SOS response-associated peptidase YedK
MGLAGLWESYHGQDGAITRTCCVITVKANELLAPINNRMPVVLQEKDWAGNEPGLIRNGNPSGP